jgi:hypothetical protein
MESSNNQICAGLYELQTWRSKVSMLTDKREPQLTVFHWHMQLKKYDSPMNTYIRACYCCNKLHKDIWSQVSAQVVQMPLPKLGFDLLFISSNKCTKHFLVCMTDGRREIHQLCSSFRASNGFGVVVDWEASAGLAWTPACWVEVVPSPPGPEPSYPNQSSWSKAKL